MAYHPEFTVSPRLVRLIEEIAALRSRIMTATVQVAWVPALQQDARVRNAHSSTAIEGNPLTLEQVRSLAEGRTPANATARSRREILNYFAGLRWIERHAGPSPIRHEHVLKLHRLLASGVMDQGEPGTYRTIAVRVGRHLPPPSAQVSGLMAELLAWWNAEAVHWSPVISSACLHFRFEDIHPFADGNGRVGRALALWELYRRGFDTHHLFAVDEFYWEDRPRYYAAFNAVRGSGRNLTSWLEYTAEGLHATLGKVWSRIQRLTANLGSSPIVLRPKQEHLLQLLSERQGLTPREVWDALGVSKQGAINLIKPLLEAKLIQRVGTRKSGRYILASRSKHPAPKTRPRSA